MSTTLEVILKTAGFTEGATAIKKVGDEATNTNNKLKTTTSTVDQVSKSTTSLGSKLANAGKQFSGTITNVAALGSTVVNLNRQYQDLSDTQIRVDRTQLKVSKTAEAVRTAQSKLNEAVKKYGASSAEAQKAQLDLTQAQEASTLAVTMNGEALEDQARAYENFAMTLAPTILTAGSSIISMFKEMGGEKGLGGIASKLKGLSFGAGGLGGLSGLTGLLGPLAIAAAAAGLAIAEYQNAMAKAAAGKKELDLAKNAKTLAEELEHIKKAGDEFKLQPGKNWLDALVTLSPTGGLINPMVDYFTKGKVAAAEAATETDNLTKARERLNKALADPAMTDWYSKEGNAARLEKQHAEEAVKLAEAKEKQIPPTEKLSSSQAAVNKEMGVTNTLLDTMTKPFTGKSVFYLQAESVDHLIGRLNALAAEADRNKFWQLMTGGNKTATTMKTPLPLFNQENLDFFVGAWEGGMDTLNTEWEGFSKASDDAAAKIVADQKAAAIEYETAWQKAFGVQVSALDKIFAAYHKLHPGGEKDILDKKGKKIGTRTTAPGQLPVDIANKAFEAFEAGLAQKITSPASAKTYAKNWMTTASAHMSGIAGQLISPITTYIKEHGNDAPEAFLAGLKDTIANYDSTKTFQELLQPGVQVGGTVGTTAGNVMAKNVNTGLKDIKIPPSTISALDAQLAKVKADMAKKPATITVTAKTNEAIKLSQEARNIINKMTAKIKVGLSYASGSPSSTNAITKQLQSVWGGGKQAGYQGTVHRPTMFIAGEGGRPEDVTVRPRGSAQRGGSGGGGFNGTINVYVDGVLRPARYDMGARK